jgi:hypothetical protein
MRLRLRLGLRRRRGRGKINWVLRFVLHFGAMLCSVLWSLASCVAGGSGVLDSENSWSVKESLMTATIVAEEACLWRFVSRFIRVTPANQPASAP